MRAVAEPALRHEPVELRERSAHVEILGYGTPIHVHQPCVFATNLPRAMDEPPAGYATHLEHDRTGPARRMLSTQHVSGQQEEPCGPMRVFECGVPSWFR